jgi:ABC-2 type transport system ATP-binding protein
MLSLLKYDKGTIEIFGKPMSPDAYDTKRNIGVVMQNVAVFNELTVLENIRYFCGLYISDKAERSELVEQAIDFVGLQDFRKFLPKKLSGGLLRRLNIACGIAHKPKLIFLDEPTVAVDPQSRNNILEGIQRLNREGATIVYTSHYMEEVENICSRICIMDEGKIIASGTQQELVELVKEKTQINIKLDNINEDLLNGFKSINGVFDAKIFEDMITLYGENGDTMLAEIISKVSEQKSKIQSIDVQKPNLEAVFLHLTGKALRD